MAVEILDFDVTVSRVGRNGRILVDWTLRDGDNCEVVVFRGESPSELTPIGKVDGNLTRTFIDETVSMQDLHKIYWYQVVASRKVPNAEKVESRIITWDGERDTVAEFIVGEHNFLCRWVEGVPVVILQRKHEGNGLRCPECFDKISKKVTKSSCTTCFGTSWVNGYYAPIYAWAQITSEQKAAYETQWGEKQPSQVQVLFTDYPHLRPNDMIVELMTDNRWKVVDVNQAEKRRRTVLQLVRLDKINFADVEYNIVISEDLVRRAQTEWTELQKKKAYY